MVCVACVACVSARGVRGVRGVRQCAWKACVDAGLRGAAGRRSELPVGPERWAPHSAPATQPAPSRPAALRPRASPLSRERSC